MQKKITRILIFSLLGVTALAVAAYRYFIFVEVNAEPPSAGVYLRETINWDGLERSYAIYVPMNLPVAPEVVIVLHGSRGDGEVIRRHTAYQFEHQAEKHGFIVVYPDGYKRHWNDCRASASYTANLEDVDDIGFLDAILSALEENYDAGSRRFVVGYSNGGHMVYKTALAKPTMFSAYAAVAANLPLENNRDCVSSGIAVSMAIFNGTNDPINPYEGGEVVLMGDRSRGAVLSSMETFEYFAELVVGESYGHSKNVTQREMVEQDNNRSTSVTVQEIDSTNHQVALYALNGSGHVIPSRYVSFGKLFGGDAGDIDLAKELILYWQGEMK